MVPQEETFMDKRLSEQATKKLKDLAAAAIARRERALHSSRVAVVRDTGAKYKILVLMAALL